jgi:hypothetical protein
LLRARRHRPRSRRTVQSSVMNSLRDLSFVASWLGSRLRRLDIALNSYLQSTPKEKQKIASVIAAPGRWQERINEVA